MEKVSMSDLKEFVPGQRDTSWALKDNLRIKEMEDYFAVRKAEFFFS